ncbi:hypothetical protein D770_24015 [Flammeovirgaceae bacterium 311]|nr:hypothetical protein D770_24015 [Flammeovirgaceae bacterium 311]
MNDVMKNFLLFASISFLFGCSSNNSTADAGVQAASNPDKFTSLAAAPNALTAEEEADGWELLFDGTNTDQWTGVGSDTFPENGWIIENEALVLAEGGNIMTRKEYADFDLRFEFNMTPAANSGIKYYVSKLTNKESGKVVTNGPEYQIIDDYTNPDVKDQADEREKAAALYLLYAPTDKNLLPAGQWNTGRIVSKDQKVEHWLNGVQVLSYNRGSQDFRERKKATKFKNYDAYGESERGHILLTDHGDKVYFRNIKIKQL